tara:strand:- start:2421 stop:2618 length:198 start_codon:yes stop_codon:yes gene_type:complete
MNEIYFAEATFKLIRNRKELIGENLMNGTVKDMEHYKFLMGSLDGLNFIEQELKSLLEKQEQNDD